MSEPRKFKRCRRYDEPGHAHVLTFSCFRGLPLLSRDRTRAWLIESVDHARAICRFDVWAWVVMPEHVHLMIYPREAEYSISNILRLIKQPVTRAAVRWLRQHEPGFLARLRDVQPSGRSTTRFWQRGGGYDRNVVRGETVRAEMDYLHLNPVRRGLVEQAEDWAWSSAAYYLCKAPVPLIPDTESLPPL